MRTLNFIPLLLTLAILPTNVVSAQDSITNQAFYIHQDQVRPSMIKEYEAVTKDFIAACKENNLQDADWSTAQLDDGTFLNISPISKMADLDNNPLTPLAEKMGEENFRNILNRFDKCYDNHSSYVVHLISNMSYMPGGLTTNTPGEDYRKWHFLYVTPENVANLRNKMNEIKALYAQKGAKEQYRVYRNGFGTPGDYYLVVISAKDAETYAKTSRETDELLGAEGEKLFGEMMQYVHRYEPKTGRMRPDLGYIAQQ